MPRRRLAIAVQLMRAWDLRVDDVVALEGTTETGRWHKIQSLEFNTDERVVKVSYGPGSWNTLHDYDLVQIQVEVEHRAPWMVDAYLPDMEDE